MSTASSQTSATMSSSKSQQPNCLDPLESLVDFSEYEQVSYHSPCNSPAANKTQFTTRAVSHTPPTLPSSSSPTLSGPSHRYDMYRQQTGIPQGAIANTLAINQANSHINSQYGFADSSYLSGLGSGDDFVDFNTAPRRNGAFNPSDMVSDMDFESASNEPAFFFPEQSPSEFINPSAIGSGLPAATVVPTQGSNVGRLWPGMHQQQALAKAQAQQKQQQQIIQQQRQRAMSGHSRQPSQGRARASHPPTDPIVEEKISQLLSSMRQNSVGSEDNDLLNSDPLSQAHRMRKDEEEMDEDERLLASEEGKKLSSKERRQLRNKVSARAFRSRRKEYISQLEGEIAVKVNENQDLRTQNRALLDENTRLSDLTRMLLSSPSFSGFLDTLSQNPAAAQTAQQVTQTRVEQQQNRRQVRKDINPYTAQQQIQQQHHIGMAMIPEPAMDFSMLDLNTNGGYSYQPQVFSVLSMPETVIDSDVLSGKTSSFSSLASEDDKVELPQVERAPKVAVIDALVSAVEVVDAEFDNDPAFALFVSSPESTATSFPSSEEKELILDIASIDFSAIPCKPSQFELIVVPTDDGSSSLAMKRVERLAREMEVVADRLRHLTMNF